MHSRTDDLLVDRRDAAEEDPTFPKLNPDGAFSLPAIGIHPTGAVPTGVSPTGKPGPTAPVLFNAPVRRQVADVLPGAPLPPFKLPGGEGHVPIPTGAHPKPTSSSSSSSSGAPAPTQLPGGFPPVGGLVFP